MRPNTLRLLRRYHLYIGLFFAPMILLFSVSGALQTFRLQETEGYGATPPNWIVWLAAVHKDQGPPREPKAAKSAGQKPKAEAGPVAEDHDHADAPPAGGGAPAKRPNPLPLKIFVALLAVALALSTVMGIVIAVATRATRRVSVILLMLGAIVPIVLLWV